MYGLWRICLIIIHLATCIKFLNFLQKYFEKYFINEEIAVTLHGCSDMVPSHKILCHPKEQVNK